MTTHRLLVTTRGKAAHAGLAPEAGINAIVEMAHVLRAAIQLEGPDRCVRVEGIHGGLRANVVAPDCRASIVVEGDAAAADEVFSALAGLPVAQAGAAIDLAWTAHHRDWRGRETASDSHHAPERGWTAERSVRFAAAPAPGQPAADVSPLAAAGHVLSYLEDQQAAMGALLEELAQLETPSSQPETQHAAFAVLVRELAVAGFEAAWWPGVRSGGLLLAHPQERPRGAPLQLLLGHCDTVWPVGTLAAMPVGAQDGRLSGPGTFDMKGGLVQILFAVRALHALGLRPPATPVLLVNSDEEIGSAESTRLIARLAAISCRAFVAEPALGPAGRLKTQRKGVGQFRLRLSGGQPGTNGVAAELARLILDLSAMNDLASGLSLNAGVVAGGGETGAAMDWAEALVDVRVPDAATAQRIEAELAGLQPAERGVNLEKRGGVARMPLEKTARNQALWRTAQTLGEALGMALEQGSAGGASDGNTTSQFTATLDGLGAVGDGAHALHEHVLLDEMPRRAALLALLLLSPVAM